MSRQQSGEPGRKPPIRQRVLVSGLAIALGVLSPVLIAAASPDLGGGVGRMLSLPLTADSATELSRELAEPQGSGGDEESPDLAEPAAAVPVTSGTIDTSATQVLDGPIGDGAAGEVSEAASASEPQQELSLIHISEPTRPY